nr:ribonuclease H-like domain-containing protein [Tanacetum cinerariifolium]
MDIKWNLALLSMRADRFWKKTSKKITIQGSDVVGFDKSKVECFNCHKMGHFARECRSPRSQDRGKRESYKKDPKVEEPAPKAMIAIDEFVDETVTDYTKPTPIIDVSKSISKELEERLKSNNPSFFEQGGSSGNVVSKPMIKFVKEFGCPNATKVNNTENARKPAVKYAMMHRNTSQSLRVRGNQRNWNNKKSLQLGKDFMMQNKASYNCGSFDHLEFNYKHDIWVDKRKTWTRVNHAQDNMKYTSTHKSMTPRAILLKSGTKPTAINRPFSTARPTLNIAQPKMTSFVKTVHSNVKSPFERKSAAKNKV